MNRKIFYSLMLFAMTFVLATGCDKDDDDGGSSSLTPKQKAVKDYEDNYLASAVDNLGWTGSVNGCDAGSVSQTSHEKVVQRINYFRRICGISDNITHNASQNSMCQEAALIMKANDNLSHYPPQSWQCWTQDGYDAAGASNIAWSSQPGSMHSTIAVTGYIEDPGSNNKKVGHRAALLLPGLEKVGHGSTDQTNAILWMEGNYDQSAESDPFVAYPPDNYIPGELMFPRWSFSITGANFNNANVTVSSDGNDYNISYEARETVNGWPDSRIVWKVGGLSYPITKDMEFDVTVSGIQNADKDSYSYTVKVFATDAAKKMAKDGKKHDYIIK
ncbi:MAG: CAP domain-containing protein [Bacteroidales bacterium]|nr:CAP domain-containing protein [Bacteroidales bacterium]